MPSTRFSTPLLAAGSPLDQRAKDLISELYDAEERMMKELPTDAPTDEKRKRRVEFTIEEIHGQPEAIATTLESERQAIADAAAKIASGDFDRIVMTGCGDSLAVHVAVRSLFEELLGIPCEPIQALDLAYYQYHAIGPKTLVVSLSSSGSTTRTVEAMLMARAMGAETLALSNTVGSPIMEESTFKLRIHAERKGWPTQASTAAIALLAQLAIHIARGRGKSERADELQAALDAAPEQMAGVTREHSEAIAEIAETEAKKRMFLFAGGGPTFAAAMFGAAKVKECTAEHALAIPMEEYHHYNSQKPGDPLFLIAPAGPSVARARDTAMQGKSWNGRVFSVVTGDESELDAHSDAVLRLPAVPEVLSALCYSVPVQLFAYHLASAQFRLAEAAHAG
ncbi:SIS domain-containing protein [Jiella marina]|uniref:SIS domain-containing protein n=1 Tax=Jiella sp. LLJ827 TaxID=2917712 RepID=UPI00210085D4|nr:SIS domain-containing protein [Jiella sp. LLJ827]MCQ0986320.1 SIS domain-containing protein [Jiella sp. LLJ827]